MKKIVIVETTDNNIYKLKDENDNTYTFKIKFHNITEKPQVNDIIYISEKLLDSKNEEYNNFYTFGDLKNKYGRKIEDEDDDDIIIIEKQGKRYYLKRLYG